MIDQEIWDWPNANSTLKGLTSHLSPALFSNVDRKSGLYSRLQLCSSGSLLNPLQPTACLPYFSSRAAVTSMLLNPGVISLSSSSQLVAPPSHWWLLLRSLC